MNQQKIDELFERMERIEAILVKLVSCLAEEDGEQPQQTLDGEVIGSPRDELESLG